MKNSMISRTGGPALGLGVGLMLVGLGSSPEPARGASPPPALAPTDACLELHAAALRADPQLHVTLCVNGRTRLVAGDDALRELAGGTPVGGCETPGPTPEECETALVALVYWLEPPSLVPPPSMPARPPALARRTVEGIRSDRDPVGAASPLEGVSRGIKDVAAEETKP